MDFEKFQKIPRLSRDVVITEKIDGTNAQIYIETLGVRLDEPQVQNWKYTFAKEVNGGTTFIYCGSRTRWITPKEDNMGFANWVYQNAEELLKLGEGRHFGEWWGQKIQRGYDLKEKRFSLFNVSKWHSELNYFHENGGIVKDNYSTICEEIPICRVVPLISIRPFETEFINDALNGLIFRGSYAAPGFMKPEGIVIYHTAGGYYFKKTIENDESPKSLVK